MRVLGRKPQGYGGGNEVYGVEKKFESTQTLLRVDSMTSVSRVDIYVRVDSNSSPSRLDDVGESSGYICSSRLGDAIESTQRRNRVDSKYQD